MVDPNICGFRDPDGITIGGLDLGEDEIANNDIGHTVQQEANIV